MASLTCPHCGQDFNAPQHGSEHRDAPSMEIVPDIGTTRSGDIDRGLDGTSEPTHPESTHPGPTHSGPTHPDRRLGAGVTRGLVAFGVIVVALMAWAAMSGRDSSPDASEPDTSGPDTSEVAGQSDGRSGEADLGSGQESGVVGGDPNFPPSDEHLIADDVAELFRTWIDDDGRDWAVVYPSPIGLQVLDSSGLSQPTVEVAVGFEQAARFPLISDGTASWAIDPARRAKAFLVSTQFVVIDIDRDGRVGFINDSVDPPNIGESSYGAWGPGFDIPANSDVLAVPSRGLFVLPVTGGTFEYTFNGVEQLSDDVLVAASFDSEIYERCDAELTCELYLDRPGAESLTLDDVDVDSTVWISPGGRWLIVNDRLGASRFIDLDLESERPIEDRVRAVDWSDDGTRAALLTDDELIVFRSDVDELRSVTLPIAASAGSVLLVVE